MNTDPQDPESSLATAASATIERRAKLASLGRSEQDSPLQRWALAKDKREQKDREFATELRRGRSADGADARQPDDLTEAAFNALEVERDKREGDLVDRIAKGLGKKEQRALIASVRPQDGQAELADFLREVEVLDGRKHRDRRKIAARAAALAADAWLRDRERTLRGSSADRAPELPADLLHAIADERRALDAMPEHVTRRKQRPDPKAPGPGRKPKPSADTVRQHKSRDRKRLLRDF
jgi:hypothetical protein